MHELDDLSSFGIRKDGRERVEYLVKGVRDREQRRDPCSGPLAEAVGADPDDVVVELRAGRRIDRSPVDAESAR